MIQISIYIQHYFEENQMIFLKMYSKKLLSLFEKKFVLSQDTP